MGAETSILISHYNNTSGLIKTVNSIIEINYPDLVIVDDGSTIPPRKSDLSFYKGAIKIIYLKSNMGIEYALNAGLEFIIDQDHYTYIARLDCGDLSHENRFKIQTDYLDKHPELDLLGSQVDFVEENGKYLYTYKVPLKHKDIVKTMFKKNCFIHPSVIFRIKAIKEVGKYSTKYKYAEDYAYFFEIMKNHKVANLDQVLTSCLSNEHGISSSNRKNQLKSRLAVIRNYAKPNIYFLTGYLRTLLLFLIPNSLNQQFKTLLFK